MILLGRLCIILAIVVLIFKLLFLAVPKPALYENYNFSSAVYDRNGKLLHMSLSLDDKYRLFVPIERIPQEAVDALLLYEDKSFYQHPGVNPLSIMRAVWQMAGGGRRQGASTITMQLARIIYNIDSSRLCGKVEQILRALQIELFYDKNEILEAYFNLAPYGGNIEGIAAAAAAYFNTTPARLNLPQILTLTVIPQNPSKRSLLYAEGRENAKTAALRLRDIWLKNFRHVENEYLNLPQNIKVNFPKFAPHFTRLALRRSQGDIYTSLDLNYQQEVEKIIHDYISERKFLGIYNAATIVLDTRTMEVLAYAGSADFNNASIQGQVDGISALRSPGSALKPFIYALALEKGLIHPLSMLKDVPKNYGLYTPENFDHSFYGLVNATEALVQSRNIPAVDLLLGIGENEFHEFLKKCGVRDLRPANFYGLAMALGGVEVSMHNLAEMYAMLKNYGMYQPISLMKGQSVKQQQILMPEAAYLTLQMLSENNAVDENYSQFLKHTNHYPVYWKTGTSYGFKDAWAVGVAGSYVIVVWVGNFDATPNNAFVGREAAAPLLFRLIRKFVPPHKSYHRTNPAPNLNLSKVKVCKDTGDIANTYCERTAETYFIPGVTHIKVSDVARLIPIDVRTGLRACRHQPPQTVLKSYNFWSSDVLQAYAEAGISMRKPPDFMENCTDISSFSQGYAPRILLPVAGSRIIMRKNSAIGNHLALKAAIDSDAGNVYWFINNHLAGYTKTHEVLEVKLSAGVLEIKAVDDLGRSSSVNIEVVWTD